MKNSVLTELKAGDLKKLEEKLRKERKELANLYLELETKKLKDTRKIFHKRKEIATILTIMNQKRSKK